jgi:20S proteasome alpha/beta subunit
METNSYQKPKMTTALAIKCRDSIVLARDTQGTQNGVLKTIVEKVFK